MKITVARANFPEFTERGGLVRKILAPRSQGSFPNEAWEESTSIRTQSRLAASPRVVIDMAAFPSLTLWFSTGSTSTSNHAMGHESSNQPAILAVCSMRRRSAFCAT